jgi:acyl-coenzyme A synthetase/AMP-(fatty) acid ligase
MDSGVERWAPDDIVFVDALSHGATGKIQKMELRRRFAGHYSSPARQDDTRVLDSASAVPK